MGAPKCFVSGVKIRTGRGDKLVENFEPGDDVAVLRNGHEVIEQVKWVGYQYTDVARHASREEAAPIRVRKNALADEQPCRDLLVSPEHCLIIDGLCVPAKLLVNGGSIISERDFPPFTYYHLELEQHRIILAENTPSESYLDTGNRASFDNSGLPRPLHPDFNLNASSARWLTDACAPLASVPDQVEPIWTRLAERSEAIGYPIPQIKAVTDADVHVLADGRILRPVSDRDGRYVFMIPDNTQSVSLMSRFCIPADWMIPAQRDTRRLGVRISWIAIRNDTVDRIIAADDPVLREGWNDVESDSGTFWRWSDGAATIPWDDIAGAAVLTVRCASALEYPVYDEKARLVA